MSLNSFYAAHYGLCESTATLNSLVRIQGALFLTFLQFLLVKLNKKNPLRHILAVPARPLHLRLQWSVVQSSSDAALAQVPHSAEGGSLVPLFEGSLPGCRAPADHSDPLIF